MALEYLPINTRIYNLLLAIGEVIILWFVIFAKVFSFNRYIGNELDVLPFARQFYHSSWLPTDWYLNLDIGYRYVFNFVQGLLVDTFGFLSGAYIGRLIGYLFLAIAFIIFFRSISLRFSLGLIVVILFLDQQSLIAGEWIAGGADTKTFAYAFALLAFALMFQKKYLLGFAFAGAGLSFHVLIGIYALFCLVTAILLTQGFKKITILELARKSWPMLITGIFGIIAISQQMLPKGVIDSNLAWKIYVEFRVPHHTLPSAWEGRTWVVDLVLATIFFLLVFLLIKNKPIKFTAAYALGSASLFFFGLIIFGVGQHSLLRFYWFRYPDVMIPLLILIIISMFINNLTYINISEYPKLDKYFYWTQPIFKYGLPILFAVIAIIMTFDSGRYVVGKYRRGLNRKPNAEQIVLEWINDNTEKDEIFLIDPLMNEFYTYANRARFVSFNHSPQSAEDILEWFKRLAYVNGNQVPPIPAKRGELQENFYLLDAELILEITNKYGIDYYLGQADRQLPFEQVYLDKNYVLYRIDGNRY